MKILITGSTGFLGKPILRLLLASDRVDAVYATSRSSKPSIQHPKLTWLNVDLSHEGATLAIAEQLPEIDRVIHLAALYQFDAALESNLQNNVLATENLVKLIEKLKKAPGFSLHASSTYATVAGLGKRELTISEDPITELPNFEIPYARTKAIAENALRASNVLSVIYRLGILVGDSEKGAIEKIDGPYEINRMLQRLAEMPVIRKIVAALPYIPFPVDPRASLPLVAVDEAARVIVEGCLKDGRTESKIYGVYQKDSTSVRKLTQAMLAEYFPKAKIIYWSKYNICAQKILCFTFRMPHAIFRFADRPLKLANPNFEADFGAEQITAFEKLKPLYFAGFRSFFKSTYSCRQVAYPKERWRSS